VAGMRAACVYSATVCAWWIWWLAARGGPLQIKREARNGTGVDALVGNGKERLGEYE
jgi:hypothetical protein